MVVSGHPLATQEAWRILERGGSVVDAAIAAAAVLAVALPQACTIGGDMFALIRLAGERATLALNGTGPAPLAAEPDVFADGIPERGPRSAVLPGAVAGWAAAHARAGRVPWPDLFAAAVDAADEGVAVCNGLARACHAYAADISDDPGCRSLFLPGGAPLAPGAVLRQPELAQTLRALADGGAPAFYAGRPAESIGRLMKQRGGILTAEDFAGFHPEWCEPLATEYRGLTVHVMPPNSYGLYLLLQLNALAGFDMAQYAGDAGERLALLIGAAHAAFAAGHPFVADPAVVPTRTAEALATETTLALRRQMAASTTRDRIAGAGGTALVTVADAAGDAIVLIQSIFLPFGAGVLDPETGILLNNRMRGFTTEPGHPNRVAPGKRPAHTLCPVMVFEGDRLRYAVGTPGGPGQTITLAQVLSLLIDRGVPIAEAVHAPRWSVDLEGDILLEHELPAGVIEDLERRGIMARRAEPGTLFFGSVEAIELTPDGGLRGIADRRRDALAFGA